MKKIALIILILGLFFSCNAMDIHAGLEYGPVLPVSYRQNVHITIDYIKTIVVGKNFYIDEKYPLGLPIFFDRISNNGAIAIGFCSDLPRFIFTPYGRIEIFSEIAPILPCLEQRVFLPLLFAKFELEIVDQDHFYGGGMHGPVYSITRDLNGQRLPAAEMVQI